jgi:hypothetical protein
VYTGITTNDNLQTALQKIDQKFQDSNLGYIFTNGLEQLAPGQPVMLGGALVKNTTIGGLYNLAFAGTLEASALITTGGTSTDFVKGDGSLDPTSYQPAGNYISNLTGDVLANGPGSVVATLATVFGAPGTYGNSGNVPAITVDSKGRITNVTPTPINYPAQSLSFVGDVDGAGFTGSPVTLTLDTVNTDVYGSNNFLKFAVNGKGLITSATPVSDGDITTALGYVPVNDAIELTINGVAHDLTANRSWSVGTVTSVSITAGTGLNASIINPNTTPSISIVNTAPDQTVVLTGGFGISVTGSYPNFTVTNDYPSLGGTVTNFSAGNLSPLFTTSVTNPTTTPALSFALSSAAANTVLAGPNGGAGAPTYRALVAADIPSLSYISNISTTAPLATTGGLTPTISISQANSTTNGYLSSTDWNTFNNKTSCTGTVTSVAVCSTTTGVAISGSPITTSGSINVDISTASASCTGLLTSTDWNTFDNKQDALGYTPVPDTRQLSINGVGYDLTADRCWSVGTVTSITASAPLTGGTITGSGSVGITQAGAGSDGYLSSADWNTFNSKQVAGNYITDLTGDGTASGPGSVALTLATVNASTGTFGSSTQVPVITVNNKGLVTCVTTDTISGSLEFIGDVTGVGSTGTCTTLTLATVNNDVYTSETLLNIAVNGKGLITSANPTTSGDICSTLGYTPENVANKSTCTSLGVSNTLYPTQLAVKTYVDNATAGGIILQGNWNANTNTPDITGTTTTGWAWRVDVAGTTNLGGITDWQVGDLAVKSATGWVKIDNTENVTSVFGRFGAIVATTGDYLSCQVTECGNLYYTDARVRAAVGHTAPLTYCSTTGVFGITQSNTTTDGYLSATDWNTFNDKQPLIVAGTTSQYYRGDKTFQTLDTSVVTEGTNLYFTDARARAAICASSGVAYNPSTGLITNSCPDQIVSLTGGGTTSITGTYPNFTITSSDCFSGTVTCVAVSGTNIGVTGSPITSAGTIGLSLSGANVCSALGYTPYNATNPAGYTTCVGTVTSVASCTSTTGVLLSGSPITTSGTLGIDISTASATCTGLLTSSDWNTFNSKTSCLGTVTNVATSTSTTGVLLSGSPVTSSGTLGINISTASSVCTGLLTSADWNTFNNKTSCLGTVTSVGLTSATTGVTIGSSPVTTSGNITLNIATASATCTGLLTAADFNNFNSHTSCTGTVTCVAATGTNIGVTGSPITTSGTLAISLSGANVCSALGFTPYNATNPNGYTTCVGTVTSVGIVATNINVCASPVTTSGNICLNLTAANVCSALGYSPAPTSSVIMVAGGGTNSTIRCGVGNTASLGLSAALAGQNNTASGYRAVVVGGLSNTALGGNSFIGGGLFHSASAPESTISGGYCNISSGVASSIVGGRNNTASGACSFIGGGCLNISSNSNTTVGGGWANCATGIYATVGGGRNNRANNSYSTVSGGYAGAASGEFSFLGGGFGNTAQGNCSFVGGGQSNTVTTQWSTLGGGVNNTISGNRGFLGGGSTNTVSGSYFATVVGGNSNTASGYGSFIGGGSSNTASGCRAVVSGGQTNNASGNCSTVGGGVNNNAGGCCSTVSGGANNLGTGPVATIGGGRGNNTASATYATIGGGYANLSCGYTSTVSGGYVNCATGQESFIGGGRNNAATGTRSTVGGGWGNTASAYVGTVGGGCNNRATFFWSTVGGGLNNLSSGDASVIAGGVNNTSSAYHSTVSGGNNNTANFRHSSVGGGLNNLASNCGSRVGGGIANTASGPWSNVGGGLSNTTPFNYATIAGGIGNTTCSNYGAISGGYYNCTGYVGFVGGGDGNKAMGNYAAIAGGYCNCASGACSFIGGGGTIGAGGNVASGAWAVIGGGCANTACGTFATITGGQGNFAPGVRSFIGGGFSNTASGTYAVVAGGQSNQATGIRNFVGGGQGNRACGSYFTTVSGGYGNSASGYASTINGGIRNTASGCLAFVGGGCLNTASGGYASVVVGGCINSATNTRAVVVGGNCNRACGASSFVGGGEFNVASGTFSTTTGGYQNTTTGNNATISGGYQNTASGFWSAIGGGSSNVATVNRASVGGGHANTASGNYARVGGGFINNATGYMSVIGGGCQNNASSNVAFVGGGQSNTASGACSFVGGGQNNCAPSAFSTISGGYRNCINANRPHAFIGGGCCNQTFGLYAVVAGGLRNTASGYNGTFVGGGTQNTAQGDLSFIGTGSNNYTSAYAGVIVGGLGNTGSGYVSFIGGGSCNSINYVNFGFIGGGRSNTMSGYRNTIVAGASNAICSGANSFIGGGSNNTISSGLSSIIGGCGNSTSGCACNVHVIGSNISTGSAANYTYVNNLCQIGGGVSDRRTKNTICDTGYGLCDIVKLRPVSYCWNHDSTNHKKYGFIAQEVQEAIPDIVSFNEIEKVGIDGKRTILGEGDPVLQFEKEAIYASYVNAFKELNEKNQVLEARIAALEELIKGK